MLKNKWKNRFFGVLVPASQAQIAPAIGYLLALFVSLFYLVLDNPKYSQEKPELMFFGLVLSLAFVGLGNFLPKILKIDLSERKSLRNGSWIVVFTWLIACTVSALVFTLAGFPDPDGGYSFFRGFTDGFFESMSGFTTTGSSILPDIEIFPRSLLLWRSIMHLIGGMGIAFLALTILSKIFGKREEIINAEAETHLILRFKNEEEARSTGFDFLKIYLSLTGVLIVLLIISGFFFRLTPYEFWHENLYDSLYYGFSTMGTGGFAPYNTSAGLESLDSFGRIFIGGLQNPVSEWLITIFMFLAGGNFALWFDLLFKGSWKTLIENNELKYYILIVSGLSLSIGLSLWIQQPDYTFEESFRYGFFNVATVMSTTGLGNVDFTLWPGIAQGLLFVAYLLGGMVGSTAGGLKIIRYIVSGKFIVQEIQNLLNGENKDTFMVDGVTYNRHNAALIMSTMFFYFILFFVGVIAIMATSPQITFPDGQVQNIDFVSALTASIANLGNIGPAIAVGSVNAGPAGNYYAYSEFSKYVMAALMFVGRIGVLSFLMLFISRKGEEELTLNEEDYDRELPLLMS